MFKALIELQKHAKSSSQGISLNELRNKVNAQQVSNEELGAAIKELDSGSHSQIHYDAQAERIYM